MNQKVEVITSDFEKLKAFLQPLLKDAVREVLQEREEQDLMLNMTEICEKTKMSEYVFRQLRDKYKIPCIGGRYSLAKVRKAMQT